ncbi:hypothetical protein ACX0KM_10840 [Pseudomonas promysalinigenes]
MDTNKMRDISREQFEAWARDENKWLIDRDSFGNYIYGFVRDSWNSWQASREAVVVELPKDIVTMAGPVLYADDIRAAIEAQGLKVEVKP